MKYSPLARLSRDKTTVCQGTNPRGVEISALGLTSLVEHKNALKIPIDWTKENVNFKPFQRWLELWQND